MKAVMWAMGVVVATLHLFVLQLLMRGTDYPNPARDILAPLLFLSACVFSRRARPLLPVAVLLLSWRLYAGDAQDISHVDMLSVAEAQGHVALVTGGNAGIGLAVAKELVARGMHVIVTARSESKGRHAVAEIMNATSTTSTGSSGSVEWMALELADTADVHRFLCEFNSRHARLDVFVSNAGVDAPDAARGLWQTRDGLEYVSGINYAAPSLLLAGLSPLLAQSPLRRLVLVASMGQFFFPEEATDESRAELCDFRNAYTPAGPDAGFLAQLRPYGRSKLQQVMQAKTVASEGQLYAYSVHPGCVATAMAWKGTERLLLQFGLPLALVRLAPYAAYRDWLTDLIWRSPRDGAQDVVALALARDPAAVAPNGAFVHSLRAVASNAHADQAGSRRHLRDCTAALVEELSARAESCAA